MIIGPYTLDTQRATYPYGELWEASSEGENVLLLLLVPTLEDAASLAEIAVERSAEIGAGVPWTATGVADDGRAWLAAPLDSGSSYADIAKQSGALTPALAASIAHQVAIVLVAAEAAGQYHAGLSDELIRLQKNEEGHYQASVYGFGLSGCLPTYQPMKKDEPFHGAPAFMSPAQAGGKDFGPAADVYALGTLMYQAIRGKAPFASTIKGASFATTLKRQIFEKPLALHLRYGRLEHIRPFETVVLQSLEKKVEKRYADATELLSGLDSLLIGMGGSAVLDVQASTRAPQAPTSTPAPTPAAAEPAEPEADELIRFEPPEELVGVSLESREEAPAAKSMTLMQGSAVAADAEPSAKPKKRRRFHEEETLVLENESPSDTVIDQPAARDERPANAGSSAAKKRRFRPEKETKVDQVALSQTETTASETGKAAFSDDWFVGTGDGISAVQLDDEESFEAPARSGSFWGAAILGAVVVVGGFYISMGGDEGDPEQPQQQPEKPRFEITKATGPARVSLEDRHELRAKVAQASPDAGAASDVVSESVLATADTVSAEASAESAQALAKETRARAQVLLTQGLEQMKSGELVRARKTLEEALKLTPSSAPVSKALAQLDVASLQAEKRLEAEQRAARVAAEAAKANVASAEKAKEASQREATESARKARSEQRAKELAAGAKAKAQVSQRKREAEKERAKAEAEARRLAALKAAKDKVAQEKAANRMALKAAKAKAAKAVASKAAKAKAAKAKAAASAASASKAAASKAAKAKAAKAKAAKAQAKKANVAAAKAAKAAKAKQATSAALKAKASAAKAAQAKASASKSTDTRAASVKRMKLGIGAYKAGRFKLAAAYFKKSLKLDGANRMAKKYLDATNKKISAGK